MYYNVLHGGVNMAISLRLNDKDTALIKSYASIHNISISDLFRQAVLEKIEDEYDLECYERAFEEFNKDPKTFTFDEVMKELDLQ